MHDASIADIRHVTIGHRFNGPPNSGNGGYVAGTVASLIEGPSEVTLRVPPPLETPLRVERDAGVVRLFDGEVLVAEGSSTSFDLSVPDRLTFEQAEAAVPGYSGFVDHTFSTCFVCGPDRDPGDGLRIFAGPVDRPSTVAAPWIPGANVAIDGEVPVAVLWAAMDCPGAFAIMDRDIPLVLGRMAAEVVGRVVPGERYVVMGWALGNEGRKHYAGTALIDDSGVVVGKAFQTWIELKE